jgi:hypothetical protein
LVGAKEGCSYIMFSWHILMNCVICSALTVK